MKEFKSWSSLNKIGTYFRYRLNLELRKIFEYSLEMDVENTNGSQHLNFSISKLSGHVILYDGLFQLSYQIAQFVVNIYHTQFLDSEYNCSALLGPAILPLPSINDFILMFHAPWLHYF